MLTQTQTKVKTGIIQKSFWLFNKGDEVRFISNVDNTEDILISDSKNILKDNHVKKLAIEKGIIIEV